MVDGNTVYVCGVPDPHFLHADPDHTHKKNSDPGEAGLIFLYSFKSNIVVVSSQFLL